MSMSSILELPARIAALPPVQRRLCDQMLVVASTHGEMVLPEAMHHWTEQLFGSVEAVRQQTIIKVFNRWTLEGALFNPTRARRPAMSQSNDAAIDAWVQEALRNDVFANPEQTTPADVWGRVRGKHCVTASNIAKYDGWHGVIVCNEPHPLRWNREHVLDYVDTAWRWIETVHAYDPSAVHPFISWNCMPKSGASLAHGHLQVALGRDFPYTRVETWRQASERYRHASGGDYFADLATIHQALELELPSMASISRFVHITPIRNREVIMFRQPTADDQQHMSIAGRSLLVAALADALYETLHMMVSFQGVRAFNAALAFPPLSNDNRDWQNVPAFVRVGDRGDALAIRSDMGVMELYGMSVITVDPMHYREQCSVDSVK